MSEATTSINLAVAATGLAICVLGLAQALIDRHFDKTTHQFFTVLFSLLAAYVSFDLFGQLASFQEGEAAVFAQRALLFLESISSASATLVLLAFLLHACGENWRRSTAFRIAAFLWVVYTAMLVFTELTGAFYFFDSHGAYHRGEFYPILLLPPILIMADSLIALIRRWKQLTHRECMAFGACIILPAIAMGIQIFSYGVYVIVLATAIAAFVMLATIQTDWAERYYRTKAENTRLKSNIMLSQLQPHFLCNTLGAIGRLCQDSPEAKQAIGTFSRYLRENVDALSQEAPVPFERELAHAQAYLELEQLRFGDDLHVVYDIGCRDFLLPTLTLQPVVENAVRHGIRKTEEGTGTVAISSRERHDCREIIVKDDGAGFAPDTMPQDGRLHVGLANVRKRLQLVCDGDLRVESKPGQGSTVTIVVPKGEGGI